ncbi:MAG: hypothetical protein WCB15_24090 [Desulfobacterales bacterium]
MVSIADGDARVALNNLEVVGSLAETRNDPPDRAKPVHIALKDLERAIQKKALVYDKSGSLPVPFHIRNAPTRLMKDIGYGKDYKYAHNYKDGFVAQEYLPEKLKGQLFYEPSVGAMKKSSSSGLRGGGGCRANINRREINLIKPQCFKFC